MIEFIAAASVSAGILVDGLSSAELAIAAEALCPHHVSHYLGMDVHDCVSSSKRNNLMPGCVFTVEPGIYIQRTNIYVRKEFRGHGFRIEDDVVKTNNGIEVLTESCERDADGIEALMSR